MNNNFFNLAKIVFLTTLLLVNFSCNTRSTEQKEPTGDIILDIKTDDFEYKIYENRSKINSHNIEQCEKFTEYNNSSDGFEIYGADVADVFSIFENINRDNISLNNKEAIFYTVIYSGKQNDSVKKEILDYILDKRNLQVSTKLSKINVYGLKIVDSEKIVKYISEKKLGESSRLLLTDDNYELTNASLKNLTTALNELYSNAFFYEGDDNKKYDLKIPLGENIDEMIDYLSENYGLDSNSSVRKTQIYIIEDKI